jgi:hypothetical protein
LGRYRFAYRVAFSDAPVCSGEQSSFIFGAQSEVVTQAQGNIGEQAADFGQGSEEDR